jgi:hypothetical protein
MSLRMHFLMGMVANQPSGLASRTTASSDTLPGIGNGIRRLGFSADWALPIIQAGMVQGGG